ncbi:MAG: glycosyltransferase [bacterium]|nr:glycosyltransferase [bacterium]
MINKKPIFSIVTPSFNQGQFIEETIQSVLSQKGDFYIEYIVIDGGSDDNSVEIINKYEQKLKNEHKFDEIDDVKFYTNTDNSSGIINCLGIAYKWVSEKDNGQTDAINKGFKMANGDIFAFLNSDDVYYDNTVFSRILEVNWEKTDFVYGKGMWFSETGEDILLYPTFKPSKSSLFYHCPLCQPTVFLKKEVFDELGEFSLEYYCVFDYEYWMRAIFNNKTFLSLDSIIARSRMYNENKSLSGQDTVEKEIGLLKEKYYFSNKQSVNFIKNIVIKYILKVRIHRRTNKMKKYIKSKIKA